eukprot:gene796-biopygen4672
MCDNRYPWVAVLPPNTGNASQGRVFFAKMRFSWGARRVQPGCSSGVAGGYTGFVPWCATNSLLGVRCQFEQRVQGCCWYSGAAIFECSGSLRLQRRFSDVQAPTHSGSPTLSCAGPDPGSLLCFRPDAKKVTSKTLAKNPFHRCPGRPLLPLTPSLGPPRRRKDRPPQNKAPPPRGLPRIHVFTGAPSKKCPTAATLVLFAVLCASISTATHRWSRCVQLRLPAASFCCCAENWVTRVRRACHPPRAGRPRAPTTGLQGRVEPHRGPALRQLIARCMVLVCQPTIAHFPHYLPNRVVAYSVFGTRILN